MKPLMKIRKSGYSMRDLQDEMNKILEDAFGDIGIYNENEPKFFEHDWKPAVEMCEHDGNFEIKAELPGINKENINVELDEDSITIKGETEHKKEEEKENIYKSEFKYGKFTRKLSFPSPVESQNAEAEYKDGILTITVPKSEIEAKKMKKLEIKD